MLEEALPSIWTSMNSWLTPTVLFVLLNVMIGSIAFTSGIGSQKNNQQQPKEGNQPKLARVASIVESLKSINLYQFRSQDTTMTALNPPDDLEPLQTEDPIITPISTQEEIHVPQQNPDEFRGRQITRIKSDTIPVSGDMPVKLPRKMKKSASTKSVFKHFEEEEIVDRRPSTTKVSKNKASDVQMFGDDEEVDAKADDFINKFRQELKLQRVDSIIRYKNMLSKSGGN